MKRLFITEDGIYENLPEVGEACCRLVIDKEAYIETFNKWIAPTIKNNYKAEYDKGFSDGVHFAQS